MSLRRNLRANGVSDDEVRLALLSLNGASTGVSTLTLLQEHHRLVYELALTAGNANGRLIGLDDDARLAAGGGVHGAGKREKIRNVVGGLQCVPEAIGQSLGDALRVGAPVVAIDMASSPARVTRLDGTVVLADHVISALSFAALRHVDISPSLVGAQAEAVRRMPYAATTRVWADISRPFWEEDGFEPSLFSDTDLGMFWVTGSGSAEDPSMGMFCSRPNGAFGSTASRSPTSRRISSIVSLCCARRRGARCIRSSPRRGGGTR